METSLTVERWIVVRSTTPTGILVGVLQIESANTMAYMSGSECNKTVSPEFYLRKIYKSFYKYR